MSKARKKLMRKIENSSKLTSSEKRVITLLRGQNGKKKTLDEVANELGLTKALVSKIYESAINKLRE